MYIPSSVADLNWQAPAHWPCMETIDMHTEGALESPSPELRAVDGVNHLRDNWNPSKRSDRIGRTQQLIA